MTEWRFYRVVDEVQTSNGFARALILSRAQAPPLSAGSTRLQSGHERGLSSLDSRSREEKERERDGESEREPAPLRSHLASSSLRRRACVASGALAKYQRLPPLPFFLSPSLLSHASLFLLSAAAPRV